MLFELQIMIATTFNGLDPIETRYKKAYDVLRVAKRILRRASKENKKSKQKIDNRKPAGDNWF
ncbi:MAG: hypothetical protein IJ593_03090 [Lachnospiraceae bacterium]|nr:hypothetical protein [Lachnospiraceae bacterium]